FFFSSRRRHTRFSRDWSSDVCSSDLRKVWQIQASGLFIDLRGKLEEFPALVGDDYAWPQSIGKRLAHEGLPGLLYPSARWLGDCLATFRATPLSHPVQLYDLTYHIDPVAGHVDIEIGRAS